MKKLYYLIPVLLIVLCATPFALYKQDVYNASSLDTASPRYWKIMTLSISSSGSVGSAELKEVDASNEDVSKPNALNKGASYKGFPFGAYFSRSVSATSSAASSSFDVSAWSWLWTLADLIIIVVAFLVARKLSKSNS